MSDHAAGRLRVDANGNVIVPGDIEAAGGYRQPVGPFTVSVLASQTNATMTYATVAAPWVAARPGSITALSVAASAAPSGGNVDMRVALDGSPIAATSVVLTNGGATTGRATFAKDTHAFSAGAKLHVVYTSGLVVNAPAIAATIEVES